MKQNSDDENESTDENTDESTDEKDESNDNKESYDDDSDPDYEPPAKKSRKIVDPYPGTEKKQEILNHWKKTDGSHRKFESMKNRYKNLSSERQLFKWRSQFEKNSKLSYPNETLSLNLLR